jgi:hypothetical protein
MRAYCRVERCAVRRKRLGNKYRPLRGSKAASHSPIAHRVCSAALSLLSMARLNIARSRWRPFSCSQTRIVQTSFGFNRTLLPIRRPLFQGLRCRGGNGVFGGHGRRRRRPAPSTSAPDRRRPARTTYPGTAQSRRKWTSVVAPGVAVGVAVALAPDGYRYRWCGHLPLSPRRPPRPMQSITSHVRR